LDPRQNLGFGFGLVFPQNRGFGFKTDPALTLTWIYSKTVVDSQ